MHDAQVWHGIAHLVRRCREIRSLYHRDLPSCAIWKEEAFLPIRFPELYAELADCQREIDHRIFTLYDITGNRRRAVVALSEARAF